MRNLLLGICLAALVLPLQAAFAQRVRKVNTTRPTMVGHSNSVKLSPNKSVVIGHVGKNARISAPKKTQNSQSKAH